MDNLFLLQTWTLLTVLTEKQQIIDKTQSRIHNILFSLKYKSLVKAVPLKLACEWTGRQLTVHGGVCIMMNCNCGGGWGGVKVAYYLFLL